MAVLRWCQETRIDGPDIASGMPMQNAFVESFNRPPVVHWARP